MAEGIIVKLNENYGIIATDAYGEKNEWIPFGVTNEMIIEKEGIEYIHYTDEVKFELERKQGIRGRDVKYAQIVDFIGQSYIDKPRNILSSKYQIIRNRMDKYNFYYPNCDDIQFATWLKDEGIVPRMLDYLTEGVFSQSEFLKRNNKEWAESKEAKFNVQMLYVMDKVDEEYRKYIMSWILGIENAYKSFLAELIETENSLNNVIAGWSSRKPKINKLVERARNKRLYRIESDEFDYIKSKSAPIWDIMEQLELTEIPELISIVIDAYNKEKCPGYLSEMHEYVGFINDLASLRNAAAHGRPIIPLFMDPDCNANWDLEFDNIDKRSKVSEWKLFPVLARKWINQGMGDCAKEIINTIYGNPFRRAWMELNFIYCEIVRKVNLRTFKLFQAQALWFLSKDYDWEKQLKNVNLLSLRLSDMGNTTLGVSPPPCDEIAQEAFAVWEAFGDYWNL